MSSHSTRRRRSAVERAELLAAYHREGLTQAEFAGRQGLSVSCLRQWLRQSRNHAPAPASLLRLPVTLGGGESCPRPYRIGLPGGVSLELAAGFEAGELAGLLQLLRGT